jgi:hypothetical protein
MYVYDIFYAYVNGEIGEMKENENVKYKIVKRQSKNIPEI